MRVDRDKQRNVADESWVVLRGKWTIQEEPSLKKMLLERIGGKAGEITVDLSEVTDVDVATVQTLYSAHVTFQAAGKRLTMSNPPEVFLSRLRQMGVEFPGITPGAV